MPTPFNFQATAYSHGWALLAPNQWDAKTKTLRRVQRLPDGQIVLLTLKASGPALRPRILIRVEHASPLSKGARAAIKSWVGRMFRQGEDFRDFYRLCQKHGGPWLRVSRLGWGRLLRSPTLFEDLVKTICTTNIQWAGTKAMVDNLVGVFGEPYPPAPAQRTFPKPAALAAAKDEQLTQARLGYRGPYIQELACRVVDGDLDLKPFENPDPPTESIRKALLEIKGIGPYAAHTLLMLLGRYEHLAFDTVMRDFLSRKFELGDKPILHDAERIYGGWGKWKFLAYWFDLWSDID